MNIEVSNWETVVDDIVTDLEGCGSEENFNQMAASIARDENLPIVIVRGIGKGSLTQNHRKSASFIQGYLEAERDNKPEYLRRRKLLSEICGVSESAIASVYAHKRINKGGAKPVVKKTRMAAETVLTDEDRGYIYTYVNGAKNSTEKKQRRSDMAEMYEIKEGSIPALMAHVTMKAKAACTKVVAAFSEGVPVETVDRALLEDPEIVEVLPVVPEESILEEPPELDEVPDGSPSGLVKGPESSEGAHIEYNNEIKNKWRAEVARTISEAIPAHKRAKMKVLCLPGKEWVEVTQIYLALGFRPENIYGVEREESIRREFEENAKMLGCNSYFGTLDEFLEQNEVPLDFVSLDFLGPLGDDKLTILSKLKLSNKAYVLVNYMAQREKSGLQQRYAFGDDMERRSAGVDTLFETLDVSAVQEHHGADFSLREQRGVGAQNLLRTGLSNLGKFERVRHLEAAEKIMARLVETGRFDEVVTFMLDKMNQERFSVSGDIGNGALNQEFEERVKNPNFKTEVQQQPFFLINYIRFVLHKNLAIPAGAARQLLGIYDIQGFEVAPGIIEGVLADLIAMQLMPIWQSYVSGVAKQTDVVGSWDYKAYINRFHSDLVAVSDSRSLKQWQNNVQVKKIVGLAFKIMLADLEDRPVHLGFTPPKTSIRGRKVMQTPPAMVVMVDNVSVSLPGDLLKKLLSKLQALQTEPLDRVEIT